MPELKHLHYSSEESDFGELESGCFGYKLNTTSSSSESSSSSSTSSSEEEVDFKKPKKTLYKKKDKKKDDLYFSATESDSELNLVLKNCEFNYICDDITTEFEYDSSIFRVLGYNIGSYVSFKNFYYNYKNPKNYKKLYLNKVSYFLISDFLFYFYNYNKNFYNSFLSFQAFGKNLLFLKNQILFYKLNFDLLENNKDILKFLFYKIKILKYLYYFQVNQSLIYKKVSDFKMKMVTRLYEGNGFPITSSKTLLPLVKSYYQKDKIVSVSGLVNKFGYYRYRATYKHLRKNSFKYREKGIFFGKSFGKDLAKSMWAKLLFLEGNFQARKPFVYQPFKKGIVSLKHKGKYSFPKYLITKNSKLFFLRSFFSGSCLLLSDGTLGILPCIFQKRQLLKKFEKYKLRRLWKTVSLTLNRRIDRATSRIFLQKFLVIFGLRLHAYIFDRLVFLESGFIDLYTYQGNRSFTFKDYKKLKKLKNKVTKFTKLRKKKIIKEKGKKIALFQHPVRVFLLFCYRLSKFKKYLQKLKKRLFFLICKNSNLEINIFFRLFFLISIFFCIFKKLQNELDLKNFMLSFFKQRPLVQSELNFKLFSLFNLEFSGNPMPIMMKLGKVKGLLIDPHFELKRYMHEFSKIGFVYLSRKSKINFGRTNANRTKVILGFDRKKKSLSNNLSILGSFTELNLELFLNFSYMAINLKRNKMLLSKTFYFLYGSRKFKKYLNFYISKNKNQGIFKIK
jgi:hypothetical protein